MTMIQGKRQGVLGHLLKDPGWDKEQSAPDSGHEPWVCFTRCAELGERFKPTHVWLFVEGAGCFQKRMIASALMRSTRGRSSGPGEQVARLQEGLVCCLPRREGLPGSPFQVVRIYTKNTVLSFPLFPSQVFWKNCLHTLSFTCIFMIFHYITCALCTSLPYVPFSSRAFTTYIFIISFMFHLFPRKTVHFPYSQ